MKTQASIILCSALIVLLCVFGVLGLPQQSPVAGQEGCYWTECKSSFTYDLKCRSEYDEQPNRDGSGCEDSLVKFQCCPIDPSNIPVPTGQEDNEGSNLPQPV